MNRIKQRRINRHGSNQSWERVEEAYFGFILVLFLAMIVWLFVTASQYFSGRHLPEDQGPAANAYFQTNVSPLR